MSELQQQKLKNWHNEFNSQLIGQSIQDKDMAYWETLDFDKDKHAHSFYRPDFTIYKGNAGILLYLISCYKYSKKHIYLNLVQRNLNWLRRAVEDHDKNHFALYTGKTGLAYVLSTLYDLTLHPPLLKEATELVLKNKSSFTNHYSDDLLSGLAGNIIALAQIHTQSENKEIFKLLCSSIDDIINNVYLSIKGLKWRYRPNYIDSLCGLSHGAAGIGYALIEVGKCYNAHGLVWLGEQAFKYENQHFNEIDSSWPDLRIHPKKLENPQSVGSPHELMKGEKVNGWAHGSAGIAMTRLRAHYHLESISYLEQTEAILQAMQSVPRSALNYSLANGFGANAYLLAEAGYKLNKKEYTQSAYQIIEKAMMLKREKGYFPAGWDSCKADLSVFMGETGIAYSILKLISPYCSDHLVLPELKKNKNSQYSGCFPDIKNILRKISKRYFPKSYENIKFTSDITNEQEPYQLINNIRFEGDNNKTDDNFIIEKKKLDMEVSPVTFEFLSDNYQRIVNKLTFKAGKFQLSEYATIIELADEVKVLVKHRYGVEELRLEALSQAIIASINQGKYSFNSIAENILSKLDETQKIGQLKHIIKKQLKQLYLNGIIKQVE
ncbi:hypothetical protein LVD15_26445 [Fulvivirga maritima]|uniref:lanthionine synthetase LanC family protein n=1 Tax=Fulvivirga maritima TaxID=2904247 RepID=UPI001F169ACC|nr:lanthionine synthetase LanC family protein [Fulvivirga maritima]UII26792.1 hypothetical protein LVD15_26445 [Fulvivirga maritima]